MFRVALSCWLGAWCPKSHPGVENREVCSPFRPLFYCPSHAHALLLSYGCSWHLPKAIMAPSASFPSWWNCCGCECAVLGEFGTCTPSVEYWKWWKSALFFICAVSSNSPASLPGVYALWDGEGIKHIGTGREEREKTNCFFLFLLAQTVMERTKTRPRKREKGILWEVVYKVESAERCRPLAFAIRVRSKLPPFVLLQPVRALLTYLTLVLATTLFFFLWAMVSLFWEVKYSLL